MTRGLWVVGRLLGLIVGLGLFAGNASAHPHVWVTMQAMVLYENGKIAGFQQRWTFDDMYTAMAVQGLDVNGDGVYSRDELKELAQVNIDGLKEFGYFTVAKLGETKLKLALPKDYWLDYKDNILTLNFTLPLAEDVLADAQGFSFAVYDESFFIAFDYAKEQPVTLGAGVPPGCAADLGIPANELADLNALNQALSGQLTAGNQNQGMGSGYAKTVKINCAKS